VVQDFTKVGAQPPIPEESLTESVRTGMGRRHGLSALGLAVDKLTGATPMGIDAPTKGLRKAIGGAAELLWVLKHGFGALIFFFVGLGSCYLGLRQGIDFKLFGFGVASLALSAPFARWSIVAAKRLRSISKA
jgi:hypothetical protein